MRPTLLKLLRCPSCRGQLELIAAVTSPDRDEVVEGELACACGLCFPIVGTIPRMLLNAHELFPSCAHEKRSRLAQAASQSTGGSHEQLLQRTQRSFGYQWTAFSKMVCDFRENFWNYLSPATPEFFRGRLGLDAGCGFGRHIYHAASCGAEMVGVDFSRAIDSTWENTRHLPNIHLVQADIYHLPFQKGTFDFAYSVGVLHHLPDPPRGVASLVSLLKPEGRLFVWLYSSKRKVTNFVLEAVRFFTTRLPYPLVRGLSWVGAAVDWVGFVIPYRGLRRVSLLAQFVEWGTPARVKLYSRYPFQVLYADWFDRLAAPVRFYYDETEVRQLVESAGLHRVEVSPTGLYGWRASGIKSNEPGADVEGPETAAHRIGVA